MLRQLAQERDGVGFVVLDTDLRLLHAQRTHQDRRTDHQLLALFEHRAMIGGKVRFALHSVDNQEFGFLTGRYRQLHVRGEGRTAHADDAGRLDPVENLFGFERAFAHQIGRKIDFRHPLVAFALDRNHHLTHPLPVGLQVDGRHRARNRSVDVGRHETRGFGDQLPREHLVAFGDLRHGRRADMLCQRNPHFVGQREALDGHGPRQFVIRRMNTADGKCLHITLSCLIIHSSGTRRPQISPARVSRRRPERPSVRAAAAPCPPPVGHSLTHLRHSLHFNGSM